MELLRRAAVFGRSHESITLTDGGALATRTGDGWGYDRGATSGVPMRAGQHYAQFTVVAGSRMMFGVVRPRWDVEGGHDAALDRQHRFYATAGGYRLPRFTGFYDDWPGQQPAREPGDRIGLLLDLEQGSMTVYKNDERLGVIQESGLRGVLLGGGACERRRQRAHRASRNTTGCARAVNCFAQRGSMTGCRINVLTLKHFIV